MNKENQRKKNEAAPVKATPKKSGDSAGHYTPSGYMGASEDFSLGNYDEQVKVIDASIIGLLPSKDELQEGWDYDPNVIDPNAPWFDFLARGVFFDKPGSLFHHDAFLRALIVREGLCRIEGSPAVPLRDPVTGIVHYELGWDAVAALITRVFAQYGTQTLFVSTRGGAIPVRYRIEANKSKRDEVIAEAKIRGAGSLLPERPMNTEHCIAFRNGVVDVQRLAAGRDDYFLAYDPNMTILNVIDVDWDPNARCDVVDQFVDDLSCGDEATKANLYEVIGLSMYPRSNKYRIAVVFLGSGANGKTQFGEVIEAVVGPHNVSHVKFEQLGQQFLTSQLRGKLVNIGEELNSGLANPAIIAVFKDATTGGTIDGNEKYRDPAPFKNRATLIFTANKMPRVSNADLNQGLFDRLFVVPFNNRFEPDNPKTDPLIIDKVTTPEAKQYWAVQGVYGMARIIRQNGMTPNAGAAAIAEELELENNTVLAWMVEEGIDGAEWFDAALGNTRTVVNERGKADMITCGNLAKQYEDYVRYCRNSSTKPVARGVFSAFIQDRYGLDVRKLHDPLLNADKKLFGLPRGPVRMFTSGNVAASQQPVDSADALEEYGTYLDEWRERNGYGRTNTTPAPLAWAEWLAVGRPTRRLPRYDADGAVHWAWFHVAQGPSDGPSRVVPVRTGSSATTTLGDVGGTSDQAVALYLQALRAEAEKAAN